MRKIFLALAALAALGGIGYAVSSGSVHLANACMTGAC
jgi:hypothetical protein